MRTGPTDESGARLLIGAPLLPVSASPAVSIQGGDDYDNEGNDPDPRSRCCGGRLVYGPATWAILILEAAAEAARGLVLPSLAQFIKSLPALEGDDQSQVLHYVAVAVALFSLGRFVGSLLLGHISTKVPYVRVLVASLVVGAVGQLAYIVTTQTTGGLQLPWLLLSRVIVGFSTGTLAVSRAALAAVTTNERKTAVMAHLGAARFVGYALTPGLSSLWQSAGEDASSLISLYTIPAIVALCIDCIVACIVGRVVPVDFGTKPPTGAAVVAATINRQLDATEASERHWVEAFTRRLTLALFMVINVFTRGLLALLETEGSPLYLAVIGDNDNDAERDTGQFFLALGIGGLVVFLSLPYLRKRASEAFLLVLGLVISAAGVVLYTHDPGAQLGVPSYVAGSVLIWSIGSPVTSTVLVATMSNLLGGKPQGTVMGLFGAMGSLGRMVLPVTATYDQQGALWGTAGMTVLCAAAVAVYSYRHQISERARASVSGI